MSSLHGSRRLEEILNHLSAPLQVLDDEVEQQLVLLALAVGKQLARRELKTDSGQITALIREAVGRLPAAAREVRVYLHPQDAAVIAERLAAPGQERAGQCSRIRLWRAAVAWYAPNIHRSTRALRAASTP